MIILELSDRKEKILSAIIEQFIATGEPVGSKFIADILPMTVSSATIRNEMAFLSENGFLSQPHTSAGRVPADKGYRYYIEKLLMNYTPSDADMFRIRNAVDENEGDPAVVLSQACEVLSELTSCAAIASTPSSPDAVITGARIMPVGGNSVMTVVSASSGTLKSRIAKTETEPDYETLQLFYKAVESCFADRPIGEIGVSEIQSACASLGGRLLEIIPLMASFYDCVKDAVKGDAIVRGGQHLLNSAVLRQDAVGLTKLLFSEEELLRLLTMSAGVPVEMTIGSENEYACLHSAAVIRAVYRASGGCKGAIAIIAPTKADYSGIIPLLKYTSETVSAILSPQNETPPVTENRTSAAASLPRGTDNTRTDRTKQ